MQECPGSLQVRPGSMQESSGGVPECPRSMQECPRTPQVRPGSMQECSGSVPECPRSVRGACLASNVGEMPPESSSPSENLVLDMYIRIKKIDK